MINNFVTGMFILFFVFYWGLLARLVGKILEKPRLKSEYWLVVGGVNAILLFFVSPAWSNKLWYYYIMMALMLFELVIFYKDSIWGALLCTLACGIHVLSIFMITVSVFSLKIGYTPFQIVSHKIHFYLCGTISFFLLNLAILIVLKIVPTVKVKLINQHREQQWFMIGWMMVSFIFLIYMASMFNNPAYSSKLVNSQIAASITTMAGLYIVLYYTFKTSAILGYKEKNAALEQAIQQEQQYRSSMVRDAIASYEINVTKDLIVKGFEDQYSELGELSHRYSDMLVLMSQKLIYSEDIPEYVKNYGRANILRIFEKGEREFISEYRRLLETGGCVWVRSIVNLVEDIDSGDVKAFVCVKNIDQEKKKQLDLQYKAERDLLTGVYNKSTTGKLIDEHLIFGHYHASSALFMIDVDNFKEINDHLGHVFGDAVLCELADKLIRIFRKNDIVGRIGGDEFIVFMKDNVTSQEVTHKALQICKAFQVTYKGVDDKKHSISSSIGISFFPSDGSTFQDLYAHADVALYEAKRDGKNTFKIYSGSDFSGYESMRTEIQVTGNVSQKGFRENRIEYVFKMLYQSETSQVAIYSVLELIASHFSFERGYIFQNSQDGKTSSNTFEWCAEETKPCIEEQQEIPVEMFAASFESFQQCGTYILNTMEKDSIFEQDASESKEIQYTFRYGIFDKNRLLGFIGFDNYHSKMALSSSEIDEMKTICNILATFIVKQYIDEISAKDLLARQEVMKHLDNYIYVINAETFKVLYMNEQIQSLIDDSEKDKACYRFFRGKAEQCEDCPMHKLKQKGINRGVCEFYNEKLQIWIEASASHMRWTDGSLACLISCSDITKQKEERLDYLHQLEDLVYVDSLTGSYTYYKFKNEAKEILMQQKEKLHILVKLDIENFKLINQIYGHNKGNEILQFVAKAMEKTVRNKNEIFARIGNDEFIALFTIQSEEEIDMLYQKFLTHFCEFVGSETAFKCKFPHGRYVIHPTNQKVIDMDEIFEKVNTAHKEAKSDKTLEYTIYDESMTQKALRIKEIEGKMLGALNNNEFCVYLQPKYFLEDEVIGGAEALVRWNNESKDLFFPNAFIPIFEENGFIIQLDFYVFRKVCHIIKEWIQKGINPVVVSVNFSRLHLDNVNFVKELSRIVDEVDVPRKYLEIEITETVIYDNIDTLEILLDEIHKNGFTMSMDDFGSGYSSLGMLKNLPVDAIKIDRSFFANQRDVNRSKTVIGSVIKMAAKLGIQTVAEGVEDQEHIDFLRELHCDMVQGYYYAKPMPVENVTQILMEK